MRYIQCSLLCAGGPTTTRVKVFQIILLDIVEL